MEQYKLNAVQIPGDYQAATGYLTDREYTPTQLIVLPPEPLAAATAWSIIVNADYPHEHVVYVLAGPAHGSPPMPPIPTIQHAWVIGGDFTWESLAPLREQVTVTMVTALNSDRIKFNDKERQAGHLVRYIEDRSKWPLLIWNDLASDPLNENPQPAPAIYERLAVWEQLPKSEQADLWTIVNQHRADPLAWHRACEIPFDEFKATAHGIIIATLNHIELQVGSSSPCRIGDHRGLICNTGVGMEGATVDSLSQTPGIAFAAAWNQQKDVINYHVALNKESGVDFTTLFECIPIDPGTVELIKEHIVVFTSDRPIHKYI